MSKQEAPEYCIYCHLTSLSVCGAAPNKRLDAKPGQDCPLVRIDRLNKIVNRLQRRFARAMFLKFRRLYNNGVERLLKMPPPPGPFSEEKYAGHLRQYETSFKALTKRYMRYRRWAGLFHKTYKVKNGTKAETHSRE